MSWLELPWLGACAVAIGACGPQSTPPVDTPRTLPAAQPQADVSREPKNPPKASERNEPTAAPR
jgi:hypothetical protein